MIYYCHSIKLRLKLSVYLTVELRNTEFKKYFNFKAADEVVLLDEVAPNYGNCYKRRKRPAVLLKIYFESGVIISLLFALRFYCYSKMLEVNEST